VRPASLTLSPGMQISDGNDCAANIGDHFTGVTSPISSNSFGTGSAPRQQRTQQPSGLSPQEHPELFSVGPWPTLHQEPQRTIFEGRQSPGRSLDGDVVSEGPSVQPSILVWYDQQVQRHGRLKQAIRDAERHGKSLGSVYGPLTFAVSVPRWCRWPTPCTPAPERSQPPTTLESGSVETGDAVWSSSDVQVLVEAYRAGASIGTVLHLGVWFFVFLIVAIGLGVANVGTGFIVILIADIVLFVMVIGLSCYSGHLRKHSEYQKVLLEELPQNVPSILQLEIASRNARMMKTLLGSERQAARRTASVQNQGHQGRQDNAGGSEMRRTREEHEVDLEIAKALEAVRQRAPHSAEHTKRRKPEVADQVAASTFTRLAASIEGYQEDNGAVGVEAVDVEDPLTDAYERETAGFSPAMMDDGNVEEVLPDSCQGIQAAREI
jgi:hypothetical protein